jgi:type II secretory pathway component PulC
MRPARLPPPLAVALLFVSTLVGAAATGARLPPASQTGDGDAGESLQLEGVIVAATAADSVALVRREGAPRARVLRIGQEIQGYVLVEVTKSSARFAGPDGDLELFVAGVTGVTGLTGVAGGTGTAGAASGAKGTVPSGSVASRETTADEGWIRRSIPRAAAKARLSKEMPVILKEAHVAPRVEDGEITGLSVSGLPDGTLLAESGLLSGDVLVSIDGEPVRGPDALWAVLSRLVDEDEIRVIVRRKGEVLKLAYDFTN